MTEQSKVTFVGESSDYRHARNRLLTAERKLRREVENVAALRRDLPDGHALRCEYEFEEVQPDGTLGTVRLSELFTLPRKSLIIYSFMYTKDADPCPMCTAFLDSFNGVARHARSQVNLAIVAKGPAKQLSAWALERGWSDLRILSSASSTFNFDYLAETKSGQQRPLITVFRKRRGIVRHFYTNEIFFADNEPGQNPRHADMVFPLWNLFDLTAEGRPRKWFPQTSYRTS